MKDTKKLFRRDKWFFVVMIGFAAVVFCYLQTFYYRTLNEFTSATQRVLEKGFIITELELNGMIWSEVGWNLLYSMQFLFWGMLILQIVKWQMFEGKRVREFQNTLPVKASSYITYDFLIGILFMWIPTMLLWLSVKGYTWLHFGRMMQLLIVEAFLYTLFVFAKKVTNHIWGAFVFFEIVIYFELIVNAIIFEREPLAYTWGVTGNTVDLIFYMCLCFVFVFLSYYCEKKRDLATNGMFSFKSVHYIALLMLLIELEAMFYGSYEGEKLLWYEVLKVVLAVGIVLGVHYLVKPKHV